MTAAESLPYLVNGMQVCAIGLQDRAGAVVTLDVVIPMKNEAPVLPALLRTLAETFAPAVCAAHRIGRVTCLFVDDGSDDDSVRIVQETPAPGLEVAIIRLSRNFGHQAAVTAGMAGSSAELVAVIDADLQDPPPLILDMVARWREGYEVVYAVRRTRDEGAVKVWLAWGFYRIYRLLTPIPVPVDSGDFCLMSRRVIDELGRLPERLRFARGLRSWVGFAQTGVEYDRPARAAGTPRYRWKDLYQLATDGIASLSLRPLQLAQVLSLFHLMLSLGGLVALMLGVLDWTSGRDALSLALVLILLSNATILFCLYIVGAYLGRAYLEVKGRPTYIVAEVLRPSRST